MYYIYVRTRKAPLIAKDDQGKKLLQQWSDGELEGEVIQIEGTAVKGKDIQRIETEFENKFRGDSPAQILTRQYQKERKKIIALPPEERHKDMAMFTLLYWSFTSEIPTKEILQTARKIQTQFFRDNPKRIHCEPIAWRELIRMETGAFLTPQHAAGYRVVERCVAQDKYYVREKAKLAKPQKEEVPKVQRKLIRK